MTSILIAGDFAPSERVAIKLDEGCYADVLSEVKPIVEHVDYALVNLESPIVTSKGVPIKKAGPNLRCSKAIIGALKYSGFKGVTLANNHFYDYGEDGALTTMSLLSRANIDFIGAGKNLSEAQRVFYRTINSKVFAFINCCENEYSIATNTTAGSNPLDPVNLFYFIKEARSKADFIIIIVHGGIEGYMLPTPRMQKQYRFFIDCGADVVVNHHQHCYSGYEEYNGKPIFYGLGNFCFDLNTDCVQSWYEGYMLILTFDGDRIGYSIVPFIQCKSEPTIKILKDVYREIERLNAIISDQSMLDKEYMRFMDDTINSQKYVLCPYRNKYLAALYVRGYLPGFLPNNRLRALQNKIACESHRDRFLYYLDKTIK